MEVMEKEKNVIIASLSNELNVLKASGGKVSSYAAPAAPPPSRAAEPVVAPSTSSSSGGDFLSQLKLKKEQVKSTSAIPAVVASPAPVAAAPAPSGGELSGVAALRAKFNKKP